MSNYVGIVDFNLSQESTLILGKDISIMYTDRIRKWNVWVDYDDGKNVTLQLLNQYELLERGGTFCGLCQFTCVYSFTVVRKMSLVSLFLHRGAAYSQVDPYVLVPTALGIIHLHSKRTQSLRSL